MLWLQDTKKKKKAENKREASNSLSISYTTKKVDFQGTK